MTKYNRHRTAYIVGTDYGDDWYLVPRGRDRAPRFWQEDGPMIPRLYGTNWELMNLLTEEDRTILLDAYDDGIMHEVWVSYMHVELSDRSANRTKDRWDRADKFLDKRGK